MITFKEYLLELSDKVMSSYRDKATSDIMNQILKRGDKRKAAKRANGVTKVTKRLHEETNSAELSRLRKELKQQTDPSRIDYLKLEIRKLLGEIELRKIS